MTNRLKRLKSVLNITKITLLHSIGHNIIFATWIQLHNYITWKISYMYVKKKNISSEIRSLRFENGFHCLLLFYDLRRTLNIFQKNIDIHVLFIFLPGVKWKYACMHAVFCFCGKNCHIIDRKKPIPITSISDMIC